MAQGVGGYSRSSQQFLYSRSCFLNTCFVATIRETVLSFESVLRFSQSSPRLPLVTSCSGGGPVSRERVSSRANVNRKEAKTFRGTAGIAPRSHRALHATSIG